MCLTKCVSSYKEPDLGVGEMSCLDRCVAKYLEVHRKLQGFMQEEEKRAAARMGMQ